MVLDCKIIKEQKLIKLKEEISKLGYKPNLCVIVADKYDGGSSVYVANKHKLCEEIGITSWQYSLNWEDKSKEEVLEELKECIKVCNEDKECNGLLVQLPLPYGIVDSDFSHLIDPNKDVDGFNEVNTGRLVKGIDSIIPCTAQACMDVLEYNNIGLEGKNVIILNRSLLVGKPLISLLLEKNATVQICHSKTKDLDRKIMVADIIITAVGKADFIKACDLRGGQIVLDVSMNRKDGKLCGDIRKSDYKALDNMKVLYTSVPAGIGVLTVTNLLENTIKCCKLQNKQNGGI